MKFYQKHKKLSMWITAFFFAAAVILFRELLTALPSIWSAVKTFLSILSPFIIGFAIAFVLYVPCVKIENLFKKTKQSAFLNKHARGLSVFAVYILGFAVLVIILVLVLPWIVRNIIGLYENREIYYGRINSFLADHCDENGTFFGIDPASITDALHIENYISNINLDQLTSVANGVYQVGMTLIDTILAIFSSIYMLTSRDPLIHSIGRLFAVFTSRKNVHRFHCYLSKISGIFYTYIYSTLIDALVVAVCCTVAFLITGVDYAPLFGIIVGIANLIPYFGAIISGICVALFVAVTDSILKAVIVGVSILVIQQIDANVLQPRIIGKSVGIQPLFTLMAITVGGGLFGFIGIILGVPLAATFQLILSDVMDMHERYFAAKETAEAGNAEQKEFFDFESTAGSEKDSNSESTEQSD